MKLIESVKEVDIYDQNDNLIDIKDYVKEPVIVVGNSPSLLNSNLGVDIDRFNTVMRINNYRSGGGGGGGI